MTIEAIKKDESVSRVFWRFAIPSVAAMLINGLYQIIDGIFVGHYVGYAGLAGINMAWPIIATIMGFGILAGMGAGSLISMARAPVTHLKHSECLTRLSAYYCCFQLFRYLSSCSTVTSYCNCKVRVVIHSSTASTISISSVMPRRLPSCCSHAYLGSQ